MSLIQNIKRYPAKRLGTKKVILLCGFGGAIWQTKRLTNVLRRTGYDVTALDFPKKVLSDGDPNLLPQLVNDVVAFVEAEAAKADRKILLVGISLGSELWKDVNIFTDPDLLRDKRALFVLPMRDKLIDPAEVLGEIEAQRAAGNLVTLVKRNSFGHVGTIIEETILFPKRVLKYIRQIESL